MPSIKKKADKNELRLDIYLQKRAYRREMQIEAEQAHMGEKAWTNVDQYGVEIVSSHCAVVGFFVGYSPVVSSKSTSVTASRSHQAEWGMDWDSLPPWCRPNKPRRPLQERMAQSSQDKARSSHEPAQSSQGQAQSSQEPPKEVKDESESSEAGSTDWGRAVG